MQRRKYSVCSCNSQHTKNKVHKTSQLTPKRNTKLLESVWRHALASPLIVIGYMTKPKPLYPHSTCTPEVRQVILRELNGRAELKFMYPGFYHDYILTKMLLAPARHLKSLLSLMRSPKHSSTQNSELAIVCDTNRKVQLATLFETLHFLQFDESMTQLRHFCSNELPVCI